MNFGTWNVKGISTKQKEILAEIRRYQMDIVAITETKKKGNGSEVVEEYIHLYSGVDKACRAKAGVSVFINKKFKTSIKDWVPINERILRVDMELKGYDIVIVAVYAPSNDERASVKDEHDNALNQVLSSIASRKEVILLGDFNAHVGSRRGDKVVGPFGVADINDNGERLVDMCYQHALQIKNGFFNHKDIHRFTWTQQTMQQKSIIDFVISSQTSKLRYTDVKVQRGAECHTDHYLVRAKVFFPLSTHAVRTNSEDEPTQRVNTTRYNVESLNNESTVFLYQLRLSSKLHNVAYSSGLNMYNEIVKYVEEAAHEALGEKVFTYKGRRNDWWNGSIESVVQEKKKAYVKWLATNDDEDRRYYMRCCREAKKAVVEAKNESWETRCRLIDDNIGGSRSTEAWRAMKCLRKEKVEAAPINLITHAQWREYHTKLLSEDRPEFLISDEENDISDMLLEDDEITIDEIKSALKSSKNGRAPGPGGLPIELIKFGTEQLLELLAYVFNRFLKDDELPPEWKNAYISNLHKKGDRKKPSNYRGLSVTNSLSRLYGRIIKNRLEKEAESVEEQSGFCAGRSCIDNISTLRQLLEKRMARNLETHLVFVDLQKAYDSVPLVKLWPAMIESGVSRILVRAVKALYTGMTSCIKVGSSLSEPFPVTKGLRQGCAIAPTLFKIYLNSALKQWRQKCGSMGIEIGDSRLFTLHFADDQVILAEDDDDICYMLRKLDEEYEKWGLTINTDKTEYVVAGGERRDLHISKGVVKGVDSYKYLGIKITNCGTSEAEIKTRVNQGRVVTKQLNSVLWSSQIKNNTKIRIYKTIVESIATYGAEVWETTEQMKKKLLAMEMGYWRRCCKVTLRDRVRNDEIRERMGIGLSIIDTIESKRLRWYGHLRRMGDDRWPRRIFEWNPIQRRKRGRPRTRWKDGVEASMGQRDLEEDDWLDRRKWKLGCEKRL